MELHHIIPRRDYEVGIMEEANAVTLCKKCHIKTLGKEYEFVEKYRDIVERL